MRVMCLKDVTFFCSTIKRNSQGPILRLYSPTRNNLVWSNSSKINITKLILRKIVIAAYFSQWNGLLIPVFLPSFLLSFLPSFLPSFLHFFLSCFLSFINLFFNQSFVAHSFVNPFHHSFIHSFIYFFIHSFLHSFIHPFIHTSFCSLIHHPHR